MYCAIFVTQVVVLVLIFYLVLCDRVAQQPWWSAKRLSACRCTRNLTGIVPGTRYTIRALPVGKWVEFLDPILPSFARDGIEHLYVEIETPKGCVTIGVRRTRRTSSYRPHSLLGRCDIQIPDCALMRATKYLQHHSFDLNLRQGSQIGRSTTDTMVLRGKPLMTGRISDAQLRVIEWFERHKVMHNHWDAVRLENSQFDFMAPWSTCPFALSCQMFCRLFHRDPSELLSRLIRYTTHC